MQSQHSIYVPQVDPAYVPWGNYSTIKKVIESQQFFPVWLTGDSGNGKTVMIEQVCAELGRKFVRINFTQETDENDLIGGMRLENGNTIYRDGPVTEAMRSGAVLLLDEIDVGHVNRIMVLQSVLEGKGVLIKQTGEWVKPEKGFNIFATSNTKGRGSVDGRYGGTSVLNSAFLDRFAIMLKQDYPEQQTEIAILVRNIASILTSTGKVRDDGEIDDDLAKKLQKFTVKLTSWAGDIRKQFNEGNIQEVVSTRSLISAVKSYIILGSQRESVKLICEKYGEDGVSFFSYFEKKGFDDEVVPTEETQPDQIDDQYEQAPF